MAEKLFQIQIAMQWKKDRHSKTMVTPSLPSRIEPPSSKTENWTGTHGVGTLPTSGKTASPSWYVHEDVVCVCTAAYHHSSLGGGNDLHGPLYINRPVNVLNVM